MDEDPELQDVREWYIIGRRVHNPFASDANLVERFDIWLSEHDAEVRAAKTVTTVEELDALPVGSVVAAGGDVFRAIVPDARVNGGRQRWRCLDDAIGFREYETYTSQTVLFQEVPSAATLLYRPEQDGGE